MIGEYGRLFLAIAIAESTAQQLRQDCDRRQWPASATLVAPQNYHLTLAFLGQTSVRDCARLIAHSVWRDVEETAAFDLRLERTGFFRNGICYLAPEQPPAALLQLAAMLQETFKADRSHPFQPHLTLARHCPAFAIEALSLTLHVDRCVLYQSLLTNAGVQYQPLTSWALAPPQS